MHCAVTADAALLRNVNVLVVDDDDDMCALMQVALERFGASVELACSAEDALRNSSPIDVVVADFGLPSMSGGQLHAELKKRAKSPAFILLTGHTMHDVSAFDGYMRKPVDAPALAAMIADVMRARIS